MTKANGAAIEEAAIPPLPQFGNRTDVFDLINECSVNPAEIGIGEAQVVLQVKFGRPRNQEWIRCHPDPERVRYFHAIKDQRGGKLYIITPTILSLLGTQARVYRVMQAITTERDLYLWPAPAEGKMESDVTHFNAQQKALTRWTRVEWDSKVFNAFDPLEDLGDPQWPDLPFKEVLAMGLSNNLIDREDHPLIKRLLGRL